MDLVPVLTPPPPKTGRRAISLIQLSLSTAGILVISGAIGIGVHASTYLQVAGYSLGYALSDAISAWATPAWLVDKGDIDVPLPLLSSGPLTDAIVAETLRSNAVEEQVQPYIAIIDDLVAYHSALITQRTMLEAASTITWNILSEQAWVRTTLRDLRQAAATAQNCSAQRTPWFYTDQVITWKAGNKTLAKELERNVTLLALGNIESVLWAYGPNADPVMEALRNIDDVDHSISIDPDGVMDMGAPYKAAYEEVRATIWSAAGPEIYPALVNYTILQAQLRYVIEPRIGPIERSIETERGRATYAMYKARREEQNQIVGRLLAAAEALRAECAAGKLTSECASVGRLTAHLGTLLSRLRAWGYSIPDSALELILRAEGLLDRSYSSRRALERAAAIETFRRNPSPYPTMIIVGAFLGFVSFWMSFLYSFFTILNMGLLGTTGHLVGAAYAWTEGVHERARITQGQRIRALVKLEGSHRPLLEAGTG